MNIEEKALEIAELKRRTAEALEADEDDKWLDLVFEQGGAIEELQQAMLDRSIVVTKNAQVRKILEELDLTEIEDMTDQGERLLYSWFSTRDYARGLSRVNALISPVEVPETLRTFVEEARQCYAFTQYNAVYSLSRTILETAVNDICVRIGRMDRRIVEEDCFNEYSFRNRLGRLMTGQKFQRILGHYKLLCRLIHGGTTVGGGEALTALSDTLAFVSWLYLVHRHFIKGPPK